MRRERSRADDGEYAVALCVSLQSIGAAIGEDFVFIAIGQVQVGGFRSHFHTGQAEADACTGPI